MKKYMITSKELYSRDIGLFASNLRKRIKKYAPEYILYRDKSNNDYAFTAAEFVKVCRESSDIKSFLHQDIFLAKELGAHGVHLTSTQFEMIKPAKELGLEVIISTHTYQEVLKARKLGADRVTYSPVFHSPLKGEPKGLDDLKWLLAKVSIPVFALGGVVSDREVELLGSTGVYGFASIRYFG